MLIKVERYISYCFYIAASDMELDSADASESPVTMASVEKIVGSRIVVSFSTSIRVWIGMVWLE